MKHHIQQHPARVGTKEVAKAEMSAVNRAVFARESVSYSRSPSRGATLYDADIYTLPNLLQ